MGSRIKLPHTCLTSTQYTCCSRLKKRKEGKKEKKKNWSGWERAFHPRRCPANGGGGAIRSALARTLDSSESCLIGRGFLDFESFTPHPLHPVLFLHQAPGGSGSSLADPRPQGWRRGGEEGGGAFTQPVRAG